MDELAETTAPGGVDAVIEHIDRNAELATGPRMVSIEARVLTAAADELTEAIAADGGCDHSVSICWCSTIRTRDALRAALCRGHEWGPDLMDPGFETCSKCPASRPIEGYDVTREFEEALS
jgi:hypothetical protein